MLQVLALVGGAAYHDVVCGVVLCLLFQHVHLLIMAFLPDNGDVSDGEDCQFVTSLDGNQNTNFPPDEPARSSNSPTFAHRGMPAFEKQDVAITQQNPTMTLQSSEQSTSAWSMWDSMASLDDEDAIF